MGITVLRCWSLEALREIASLGRIFSWPRRSMPGTMPLVERVTCLGENARPSGSSMMRSAAMTASKLRSGSPWPMSTRLVCGASWDLCCSSGSKTCARISAGVRLRIRPSCAVRQKWQSTAQPAWVEMQMVCRPVLGMKTASTEGGREIGDFADGEFSPGVQRVVELVAAVGGLAERDAEVAQLALGFAEKFHLSPCQSIISRTAEMFARRTVRRPDALLLGWCSL